MRLALRGLLATVVVAAAVGAGATVYAAAEDPVEEAKKLAASGAIGSNNWDCKPTAAKPRPIVLVHGTFANPGGHWSFFSPQLASRGYCVFVLGYGSRLPDHPLNGTMSMTYSANQLAVFVRGVLAATGADKVSLIGHSQGGTMPRHYLRFLGGAAQVEDFIGLAPPNHGLIWALPEGQPCEACSELRIGSDWLDAVNSGREVEPGVDYTTIRTRYDYGIIPGSSSILAGPAGQVTNVLLQDKCPLNIDEHIALAYDPPVLSLALNALQRSGPLDPGHRPVC